MRERDGGRGAEPVHVQFAGEVGIEYAEDTDDDGVAQDHIPGKNGPADLYAFGGTALR